MSPSTLYTVATYHSETSWSWWVAYCNYIYTGSRIIVHRKNCISRVATAPDIVLHIVMLAMHSWAVLTGVFCLWMS